MTRTNSNLGFLLGTLVVVALIALDVPQRLVSGVTFAAESGRLQAVRQELSRLDESSNTFRQIARSVKDGVVQIRVQPSEATLKRMTQLAEAAFTLDERLSVLRRDDGSAREMEELLDQRRAIDSQREDLVEREGRGTGSGVMYDSDGHILTNNHVVAERGKIDVRLADGREFPASVVGLDPKSDLAIIKISGERLSPLKLGDSDQADVGDWVLAVGAPFGLSQSVTHGIISAKGRQDIFTGRRNLLYQNFMQTDAAINPGNSGGPLVNLRGEVIGINTAIAANEDGVNAGIAFTIPSNYARKIADQLRTSGKVARGWLGVSLFDPDEVDSGGRPLDGQADGVEVNAVYRDGPAGKAGLLCDDLIVTVNKSKVETIRQLQGIIADVAPSERITLGVLRDGKDVNVVIELGRQPDDLIGPDGGTADVGRPVPSLALLVRTLRPNIAYRIRSAGNRALLQAALAHRERSGVLVVGTTGGDWSAMYNLGTGDAITAVDGKSIAAASELAEAVAAGGASVSLTVFDPEGAQRTVEMKKR